MEQNLYDVSCHVANSNNTDEKTNKYILFITFDN